MIRRFVRSIIRNARITNTMIGGDPALTIDPHLMAAADIRAYEAIEIVNRATGDRFTTHAVPGQEGSGEIYGLAGIHHSLRIGDSIAIICYADLYEGQTLDHQPRVVEVDGENRVVTLSEVPQALRSEATSS